MFCENLQDVQKIELNEQIGSSKGERSTARIGCYLRFPVTRVGNLELRTPQDRDGRFSTDLFARYQRSEKALLAALVEMYVSGVSTRKARRITEDLCGHSISTSTISNIVECLDEQLKAFSERALEQPYPYLILDARYERVRENGIVGQRAVQIALGVDADGRRHVLGVDLTNRERLNSWKDFLLGLCERGLKGVRYVVSDDHAGLRGAVTEVLPAAAQQRCYIHFLRNTRDRSGRKDVKESVQGLRRLYDCQDLAEARSELAVWLQYWQERNPRLANWVEENIEVTFSFYSLPVSHRRHMRSTTMLERVNQEIKLRTTVVHIFPNRESYLRLMRAFLIEMHENWQEGQRYLGMRDAAEDGGEPCG